MPFYSKSSSEAVKQYEIGPVKKELPSIRKIMETLYKKMFIIKKVCCDKYFSISQLLLVKSQKLLYV